MPHSDNTNVYAIVQLLDELRPASVLDVGAGAGKYGDLVRQVLPDSYVDAIEVWEPYIDEYLLNHTYRNIIIADVRTVDIGPYDLVIFGDVLEHMTKEESIKVFNKVTGSVIISIPIVHYPQGHSHGNPYEEHIKDDWSVAEVLDTFDVELVAESDITAVFVKR